MPVLRAAGKALLFSLLVLIVVPSQSLVLLFHKGDGAYILPRLFHRAVCLIFGVRHQIIGTPCTDRQTIFMSNHISYLDIPLIGSLLKASFVAKKEVKSWPLFGFLSTLQQTEFVERRPSAITAQKEAMNARLAGGRSLIIFPEGTSTDGQSVLPFKTSLFSLALEHKENLWVQPVTIKILSVDGQAPDSQDLRDLYSWHRDMDTSLARHLWRFAKSSGAVLALIFHPPIPAVAHDDRKTLAKACHDNVSKGLETATAA